MKKILTIATLVVALTTMSSCGSSRYVAPALPSGILNLAITENPTPDKYANMDYGIRLNVADARAKMALVHAKYLTQRKKRNRHVHKPDTHTQTC